MGRILLLDCHNQAGTGHIQVLCISLGTHTAHSQGHTSHHSNQTHCRHTACNLHLRQCQNSLPCTFHKKFLQCCKDNFDTLLSWCYIFLEQLDSRFHGNCKVGKSFQEPLGHQNILPNTIHKKSPHNQVYSPRRCTLGLGSWHHGHNLERSYSMAPSEDTHKVGSRQKCQG